MANNVRAANANAWRSGLNLASYDACVARANEQHANDADTHFPSSGFAFEQPPNYLARINTSEGRAVSAVVASWFHNSTEKANPLALALYVHSSPFITAAYNAMTNDIVEAMNRIYGNFSGGQAGTLDALTIYKQQVGAFRTNLEAHLQPGMMALIGEVTTRIEVSQMQLAQLRNMIREMQGQRQRLAGNNVRENQGPPAYYDAHMQYLEDIAAGGDAIYMGSVALSKRQAVLKEGIADIKNQYTNEPNANYEGKGVLLLATSIAYSIQKHGRGDFINGLPTTDPIVASAKVEGVALANLAPQGEATFSQQVAQIDIIFNTYYWIKKARVTRDEIYIVNSFFHNLGRNVMGTEKKRKLMLECRFAKIVAMARFACTAPQIHTPPFIFCFSRTDDIVPVLGTFSFRNLDFEVRGVSWRNALNIRLQSHLGLTYILDSYNIEASAYRRIGVGDTEPIYKSFHLFHQFLTRKESPYEWAGNVTGDALRLEIVPVGAAAAGIGEVGPAAVQVGNN